MSGLELKVTILNEKVVQVNLAGGDTKEEKVELDSLRLQTIQIFVDWLSRGKISRRKELEVLGKHLFEAIFNGEVKTGFENGLKTAQDTRQRLVVRLNLKEEAVSLAELPWEYLYYPDTEMHKGFFLATNVDLVLARYVSLEKNPKDFKPEKSPLRILIVVSNPASEDLTPVVKSEEIIQLIQGLTTDLIETSVLDKPTFDNFSKCIEKVKPHVLHFIGHGRYNTLKKVAEIALLQDVEKNSVRWVGEDEFAEYFTYMQSKWVPPLILLHLCESATPDKNNTFTADFARLGRQLVRSNIPAVVAMQYPIPHDAAIAFCRSFYLKLAAGETIDNAVQEGRWRITTSIPTAYDDRVFGTPVLYMRSYGGIIQTKREQETSSTETDTSYMRTANPSFKPEEAGQEKTEEKVEDKTSGGSGAGSVRGIPQGGRVKSIADIAYAAGRRKISELTLPFKQQSEMYRKHQFICRELRQVDEQEIIGCLSDEQFKFGGDLFVDVLQAMIDAIVEEMP